MTTILISGATGHTGAAVLQHLKPYQDLQLRALTRDSKKAAGFKDQGIDGRLADFSDPSSLDRVMQGVDRMYLVHTPSQNLAANEKNAIDAAGRAGVQQIVKLSVFGCDPKIPAFLPQAHAEVENYLQNSGIGYTILRPHSFMQNLLGSVSTIQGQGALYSSLGEAKVPLIDVRDIGAVAAKILHDGNHFGKIYELTGPEAISYQDIALAIGATIGKEVNYVAVPDEAAKQGMVAAGFPEWLADDLVVLTKLWREGTDNAATKDVEMVLGHSGHSLADFVRDYALAFKG